MTAVKVNASGSRNDVATARHIPRTPAHLQGGIPVRPVLDSPPYVPPPSCIAIKKDGTVCGGRLRGSQQLNVLHCVGHIRYYEGDLHVDKS